MRKGDFSSRTKYLLIMELRFDAKLHSNMGNENSDAGHIKCSGGPQVPHPWVKATKQYLHLQTRTK